MCKCINTLMSSGAGVLTLAKYNQNHYGGWYEFSSSNVCMCICSYMQKVLRTNAYIWMRLDTGTATFSSPLCSHLEIRFCDKDEHSFSWSLAPSKELVLLGEMLKSKPNMWACCEMGKGLNKIWGRITKDVWPALSGAYCHSEAGTARIILNELQPWRLNSQQ